MKKMSESFDGLEVEFFLGLLFLFVLFMCNDQKTTEFSNLKWWQLVELSERAGIQRTSTAWKGLMS
jgi:hypothetical protein